MKFLFLIASLLILPHKAFSEPVPLAPRTPLELKITARPPKGRIFNEQAPSKFLVRFREGWQQEGTLTGEQTFLSLPQLKEGENCTVEVKISYFHCDKMGFSQCIRVAASRTLEVIGSENSGSKLIEVYFE